MSQGRPDLAEVNPANGLDLPRDSKEERGSDAEARGWAERLLDAEEPILQSISDNSPLVTVLDSVCSMIEGLCDRTRCSIRRLDAQGGMLQWLAAPSITADDRAALESVAVGDSWNSRGTAIPRGGTVIVVDIATDPWWMANAPRAIAAGLLACWSVPIRSSGGAILAMLDTFCLDSRSPRDWELRAIARSAHLASIAIARSLAEESLGAGEERYRRIVETAHEGIWTIDKNQVITYVNNRMAEMLGYRPDELVGRSAWELSLPEDHPAGQQQWERKEQQGSREYHEFRLKRKDGSIFWGHFATSPINLSTGEFVGALAMVTDLSERVQAETKLRASELRLRQMTDSMPQIAWIASRDGVFEHFNHRWYEYTGKTAEESFQPDRLRTVVHPDDAEGCSRESIRARTVDGVFEMEFRLRGVDGNYRWFLARSAPVHDEDGRVVRRFGTATDIHDRKRLEDELRQRMEELAQADHRKDEFLATLAHELRNPLAPIRSALQLMAHAQTDPSGMEGERLMAERQVIHLARLVDDLMDVARINRGRIELRRESVELGQVVIRAVEAARTSLVSHRHRLILRLPETPVFLDADATRLEQVLDNLLTNAIKYTEPGGELTLTALVQGDEAAFVLKDNGIGIDPEMISRVFEMFVQAERRSHYSQGGLGIGLGLVKSLVELHGGRIEARSHGRGQGTEFEVHWPLAVGSAPVSAGTVSLPTTNTEGVVPRRILVVDDNVDAALSLAKILKRIYRQSVEVAHDGPSAMVLARSFQPDLIFLDLGMPGMDGYEVAQLLRLENRLVTTMLVALTGWGLDADRARSKQAGFDHHLVKPVGPDELERFLLLIKSESV